VTEIYGTLGPACSETGMLEAMLREGMTGMRLNLSHGSLRESAGLIQNYREAAELAGAKADFLIDLQGPELRIGTIGEPVRLLEGECVHLVCCGKDASGQGIPVGANVFSALEEKDRILLDDGRIELLMQETPGTGAAVAEAVVVRGGLLDSRKSIKIVGKSVDAPALTEKDRENIRDARAYGVSVVMQPFVRNAAELMQVREELDRNGLKDVRLFAKIENREGVGNLEEIITACDLVVIARGDLGNDMPLWELPAVQKQISQVCRKKKRPFMVVTQMMTSMIHNPVPTRAEVSDVYNAVNDGASAVMVTNETAVGEHPVEVIRYLARTVKEAEQRRSADGEIK
jgi:pyruvate kinase